VTATEVNIGKAKLELAVEVLRSFGELRFRALGESMLPSIFPGDIVVAHRARIECFAAGDVALFSREGRFYAHRVVERFSEGGRIRLVTRGDSVPAADPPITQSELLGRVRGLIRGNSFRELKSYASFAQRILAAGATRSALFASVLVKLAAWHQKLASARSGPLAPRGLTECR
jgi:hypothetical protein